MQKEADKIERHCDRKCGANIRWDLREQHYSGECPNSLIECPSQGCSRNVTRKNMHVHLRYCEFRKTASNSNLSELTLSNGTICADERDIDSASEDNSSDSIVHSVSAMDTLAGISILYGVSKGAIMRHNRLLNENIIAHKILLIPPQPKRTFRFRNGDCSPRIPHQRGKKQNPDSFWKRIKSVF
eukprot:Nk52_evm96s221 gene=Nk52_evmTU96s221